MATSEDKPSLPTELLQTIFEEVRNTNKTDLSNIRLASHYFCSIVTPHVFRTIHVQDTVESTNKLHSILMSPHLVKEIKEICIIQDKIYKLSDYEDKDKDALLIALMDLRRASSLTALHLTFFLGFEDPPTSQTSVICLAVASIPPSSLTSLSFTADNIFPGAFQAQSFASMISSLTHLSIVTPRNCALTPLKMFWDGFVSLHFLQPAMATLTSLRLHPDLFVGTHRSMGFPSLFFPCLTRLSLRMFLFEPSNHLKCFIIRHGTTLTHLHLEECPIITHYCVVNPVRHQSDIWHHFAERFEVLIEVTVTESWDSIIGDEEYGSVSRYMTCAVERYGAYHVDMDVEVPDRIREDNAALEAFKSVVNAKRKTLRL